MANMFTDGLAWFNEQIAAAASVKMTFHRGSQSVEVDVIPRRPLLPPITGTGPPPDPKKDERDLEVVLDDLAPVLGTDTPLTSDYFTEGTGDDMRTDKVASPSAGGPWWEWTTGYRGPGARIRIHTKHATS